MKRTPKKQRGLVYTSSSSKKRIEKSTFYTEFINHAVNKFTIDVLLTIFNFVDTYTLAQCTFVCRKWCMILDDSLLFDQSDEEDESRRNLRIQRSLGISNNDMEKQQQIEQLRSRFEKSWRYENEQQNRFKTDQIGPQWTELSWRSKYFIRHSCLSRAREQLTYFIKYNLLNDTVTNERQDQVHGVTLMKKIHEFRERFLSDCSEEERIRYFTSLIEQSTAWGTHEQLHETIDFERSIPLVTFSGSLAGLDFTITIRKASPTRVLLDEIVEMDTEDLSFSFVDKLKFSS